jgi:hypothetical protein
VELLAGTRLGQCKNEISALKYVSKSNARVFLLFWPLKNQKLASFFFVSSSFQVLGLKARYSLKFSFLECPVHLLILSQYPEIALNNLLAFILSTSSPVFLVMFNTFATSLSVGSWIAQPRVLNFRVLAFSDLQNPGTLYSETMTDRNLFAYIVVQPKSDMVIYMWEHLYDCQSDGGANVLV